MPTLSLQVTAFQSSILQRLVQRTGVNLSEFILDRLFTALANRLALDLATEVGLEQQFISAGNATACGTTYAVTAGTQPWTYICVRITGHQTDGVVARQTHVAPGPDGALTSWQDGQA